MKAGIGIFCVRQCIFLKVSWGIMFIIYNVLDIIGCIITVVWQVKRNYFKKHLSELDKWASAFWIDKNSFYVKLSILFNVTGIAVYKITRLFLSQLKMQTPLTFANTNRPVLTKPWFLNILLKYFVVYGFSIKNMIHPSIICLRGTEI